MFVFCVLGVSELCRISVSVTHSVSVCLVCVWSLVSVFGVFGVSSVVVSE